MLPSRGWWQHTGLPALAHTPHTRLTLQSQLEPPSSPEQPLPLLHRGTTVHAMYGCAHPPSRLCTDAHCLYAAPTPVAPPCTRWAAAAIVTGRGLEAPRSPCRGPHQPCNYSKQCRGPAGAAAGGDAGGSRHARRQMPERWESSEVKKQEENPNQAMGMQACEGEQQPATARPKRTAKETE